MEAAAAVRCPGAQGLDQPNREGIQWEVGRSVVVWWDPPDALVVAEP